MSIDHTAVLLALRAQMLGTPGLPMRNNAPNVAYDNVQFAPVSGEPYVAESFVPATQTLKGLTSRGVIENTGLYLVHWLGAPNTGLAAISRGCDALLARFAPESQLTATSGDVVRIRGDVAPYRGPMKYDVTGWVYVVITIPWRVLTLTP